VQLAYHFEGLPSRFGAEQHQHVLSEDAFMQNNKAKRLQRMKK